MNSYSVTLTLDTPTLDQLTKSGYSLCCLLAAQVGDERALPLLWSASQSLTLRNVVTFQLADTVFTALAPAGGSPVAGDIVTPGYSVHMSPGQLLTVQADGVGTLSNDGYPDTFTVLNASTTEQLCGLVAGSQPLCALPLPGQSAQLYEPLPKIMLFFANGQVPPVGTAIDKWPGGRTAALLIDASQGNNPTVSFNIDTSWDYGQQAWGTLVPFTETLAPYLLTQQASLQQEALLLIQRLLPDS